MQNNQPAVKCPNPWCGKMNSVRNMNTGSYTCPDCWTIFMPEYTKMTEAEKIAAAELIARTIRYQ